MKCFSCSIDVPPAFSKAIADNTCPACGKDLFNQGDFKEIIKVKDILGSAGLDEKMVFGVAAALANKYDIVLKNKSISRAKALTSDVIDSTDGLSDDERQQLRTAYASRRDIDTDEGKKIKEEWGLDHGELAANTSSDNKRLLDPDMAALFLDVQSGDIDLDVPPLDAKGSNHISPKNAERLARAEALRSDPTRFKFARSN